MSWLVLAIAAVLAFVAAAGVLRPFGRSRVAGLERLADPLDDERLSLLRALRELEDERASGLLAERDYRELRRATEARAVAVLRALEARDGAGELDAGLHELREERRALSASSSGGGNGHAPSVRRRLGMLPTLLVPVLLVAITAPLLAGAIRNRAPGETITGTTAASGQGGQGALAFFEERVRKHPRDVAARLDLGQRYMGIGALREAFDQYLAALRLHPGNAEARANLGYLVYRAGRGPEGLSSAEAARKGLRFVESALDVAPGYPEALYYKGLILLRGLGRPAKATEAFRAYLAAAPFGSRRAEVERLLAKARS